MRILGEKRSSQWTLLKVNVNSNKIDETVALVRRNLLTVGNVPYYAHFYRDDELIVMFPERVFHATPNRSTWGQIVSYGNDRGIPAREMDIRPCRFEDETY